MQKLTLKEARESLNISKTKISKAIGVSISNLTKIEYQAHKPRLATREKINNYFSKYDIEIEFKPKLEIDIQTRVHLLENRIAVLEELLSKIGVLFNERK